ncbi:N-acyl-D-amino-acid deacylase family protein [Paralcaligenes ginsengisoli]
MFDTIIAGGEIIDGTGAPSFVADIGIAGDRIIALGDLKQASAANRIDASGLTVTPGFIDIHTHSDFTLLADGRADSQLCQGVTTEVIGQCGFSCAPLGRHAGGSQLFGYVDVGVPINWRSFGEYLEQLEKARPAVNVAAFVGHGAIHGTVKENDSSPSTADEIAAMQRLTEEAFDDGAWGFSTGLEYWPGIAASLEEITTLTTVAAKRNGLYSTHVRNRDVYYDLGFSEAIATARHTNAKLQISHIQPKFGAPAMAMQHTLEMLYRAEREGVDVAFDIIPHDWNHTSTVSVLPMWAREGGTTKTLERLKNPALRKRMKENPNHMWRLVTVGRWSDIVLLHSVANAALIGMNFSDIAQLRGVEPFDAVLDLLMEEGEGLPQMMWTSHSFNDNDICMCMRENKCMVMSDTLALSQRGPLKGLIGSLSGYGWTARLLGHYARERGIISLVEAVNRITVRPAERLGLADRGRLRAGAFADVTVFNPELVHDESTVRAPLNSPKGFVHVMVNGRFAVRDGMRNDVQSGRVLRH